MLSEKLGEIYRVSCLGISPKKGLSYSAISGHERKV